MDWNKHRSHREKRWQSRNARLVGTDFHEVVTSADRHGPLRHRHSVGRPPGGVPSTHVRNSARLGIEGYARGELIGRAVLDRIAQADAARAITRAQSRMRADLNDARLAGKDMLTARRNTARLPPRPAFSRYRAEHVGAFSGLARRWLYRSRWFPGRGGSWGIREGRPGALQNIAEHRNVLFGLAGAELVVVSAILDALSPDSRTGAAIRRSGLIPFVGLAARRYGPAFAFETGLRLILATLEGMEVGFAAGDRPLPFPIPDPAHGWYVHSGCSNPSAFEPPGNGRAYSSVTSTNCAGNQAATGFEPWPPPIPFTHRIMILEATDWYLVAGQPRLTVYRQWRRAAPGPTGYKTHETGPLVAAPPGVSVSLMPPPGLGPQGVPVPGDRPLAGGGSSPPMRLPPLVAPSGHTFKKPASPAKEKKVTVAAQKWLRVIGKLTEAVDWTEAMYESLPRCRLRLIYKQLGRQPTAVEKAGLVLKYGSSINAELAIWNAIKMEVEDRLDGAAGQRFGGPLGGLIGREFALNGARGARVRGPDGTVIAPSSFSGSALANAVLSRAGSELFGLPPGSRPSDTERLLRAKDAKC